MTKFLKLATVLSSTVVFTMISCKDPGADGRYATSGRGYKVGGATASGDATVKPSGTKPNSGDVDAGSSKPVASNSPTETAKPVSDVSPMPTQSPSVAQSPAQNPSPSPTPTSSATPPNDTGDGLMTGPTSEISIVGLRADMNDMPLELQIKKRDGKWGSVQWPTPGQTVKLEGVCNSKKDVTIEIKTVLRGKTYVPTNASCFIGKQDDPAVLLVGFEHDCRGTTYQKIDDAIARFSCPEKGLKIDALRLDPAIILSVWLD